MSQFKKGDYVIYQNGDSYQIGKVKHTTDRGAFVYYHEGDTAALTPFANLHKIDNAYVITSLGGKTE